MPTPGLDRLLLFLGVYEGPSHALDELVGVVFVGEHLRGHVLGEQVKAATQLQEGSFASCPPPRAGPGGFLAARGGGA